MKKTRNRKKKLNIIKEEVRVLGVDDAPFSKYNKNCLVVATVFRGGQWLDGLLSCYVEVDGYDATKKLIELIKKTRHYGQLSCIMLNGIALAGFNVVDIQYLNKKTRLPVIVVTRKMPNFSDIKKALRTLRQEEKLCVIKKAGKLNAVRIRSKKIFFQSAGISKQKAKEIIQKTATRSLVPEPVRVAHLIARGIAWGESKGRV